MLRKGNPAIAAFLESFLTAQIDKEIVRIPYKEFIQARIAGGIDRASAKAEVLGITNDLKGIGRSSHECRPR